MQVREYRKHRCHTSSSRPPDQAVVREPLRYQSPWFDSLRPAYHLSLCFFAQIGPQRSTIIAFTPLMNESASISGSAQRGRCSLRMHFTHVWWLRPYCDMVGISYNSGVIPFVWGFISGLDLVCIGAQEPERPCRGKWWLSSCSSPSDNPHR
jgi:hypothetical protein